jgi:hypothetical protein
MKRKTRTATASITTFAAQVNGEPRAKAILAHMKKGNLQNIHVEAAQLLRALAQIADAHTNSLPARAQGSRDLAKAAKEVSAMLFMVNYWWISGDCRTIDEAIGRERPAKWRQDAAQRTFNYQRDVFDMVTAYRLRPSQPTLIAALRHVARELPISASTARDLYQAECKEQARLTRLRK